MDLLSEIGDKDQLISAREENKVLRARVEELKEKVKALTVDNAALLAEVEMYRKEAALPTFSTLSLGGKSSEKRGDVVTTVDFAVSGNGTYPMDPAVCLNNLHGSANLLCTALDATDTIIATGGADSKVSITCWGSALSPSPSASDTCVQNAAKIVLTAPVIQLSFSKTDQILAAGCMDGSVHFIGYSVIMGKIKAWKMNINQGMSVKYSKYVKGIDWSPTANIVASCSSDGTATLVKVTYSTELDHDTIMISENDDDDYDTDPLKHSISLEEVKSFHFSGSVETLCFDKNGSVLILYERDTSYLTYVDLVDEFKLSTYSVNGNVCGGYDGHVSFAILQLALSPDGKYICAATDASRNIIIEVGSSNIIRDLYGHKNDGFSNPRVAWSQNGQYIFGNTQEDCSLVVWDVASSKIVQLLKGHNGQLRDIYSSKNSDIVVTASFDKTCRVWLNEM
jgi:WD40 repeat protein